MSDLQRNVELASDLSHDARRYCCRGIALISVVLDHDSLQWYSHTHIHRVPISHTLTVCTFKYRRLGKVCLNTKTMTNDGKQNNKWNVSNVDTNRLASLMKTSIQHALETIMKKIKNSLNKGVSNPWRHQHNTAVNTEAHTAHTARYILGELTAWSWGTIYKTSYIIRVS